MTIFIPTAGRIDKQPTLSCIPDPWLEHTKLVVNPDEFETHRGRYGEHLVISPTPETSNGIDFSLNGVSPVRQWVLQNTPTEYCFMADDDMVFNVRDEDGKLRRASNEEVGDMLSLLVSWLDEGLIHVGVSARQHNFTVEGDYAEIARMNNAYAFNAPAVLAAGGRFDRLEMMEDFDITLTLLELGYPNRVTYKYCWGQRGSGAVGGASRYRTSAGQDRDANKLRALHPYSVSVVKKTSKETWAGFDSNERTDVIISWQKAFGLKTKKGIDYFF